MIACADTYLDTHTQSTHRLDLNFHTYSSIHHSLPPLHRLEPMDKDGMYVVHDVVDDYPELASIAIGDLEERHVVIYRIGFHPVGMIPYRAVCIIPYDTVKFSICR